MQQISLGVSWLLLGAVALAGSVLTRRHGAGLVGRWQARGARMTRRQLVGFLAAFGVLFALFGVAVLVLTPSGLLLGVHLAVAVALVALCVGFVSRMRPGR
jgi:hypothetical protein